MVTGNSAPKKELGFLAPGGYTRTQAWTFPRMRCGITTTPENRMEVVANPIRGFDACSGQRASTGSYPGLLRITCRRARVARVPHAGQLWPSRVASERICSLGWIVLVCRQFPSTLRNSVRWIVAVGPMRLPQLTPHGTGVLSSAAPVPEAAHPARLCPTRTSRSTTPAGRVYPIMWDKCLRARQPRTRGRMPNSIWSHRVLARCHHAVITSGVKAH
jgi:hypothetical protein